MIKTKVMIVDSEGHAELELTRAETMEIVDQNANAWVFAMNQRVQPTDLADADWGDIGTIRIVPPLVGGL
jgi:hypothetical protein